jgi:hypothetical protein
MRRLIYTSDKNLGKLIGFYHLFLITTINVTTMNRTIQVHSKCLAQLFKFIKRISRHKSDELNAEFWKSFLAAVGEKDPYKCDERMKTVINSLIKTSHIQTQDAMFMGQIIVFTILQHYNDDVLRNRVLEKCTMLQTIKLMRDKSMGCDLEIDETVDKIAEFSETLYHLANDLKHATKTQNVRIWSWIENHTNEKTRMIEQILYANIIV